MAWRVGVRPSEYRELEAGDRWPTFDTYDRICKLFGWPQTFASGVSVVTTGSSRKSRAVAELTGPETEPSPHQE